MFCSQRDTVILCFLALICVITITNVEGKIGYGPGEQNWGWVEVRENAMMFYWLYYTTASNIKHYTDRPLLIWLQGGPGASSTGYGNFEELGPLTLDGDRRNHTWVQNYNVLFIDNPVGTGFSFVETKKQLAKNNKEIALDLVELMKNFYERNREFENVPLHIFSESYGGKMAIEFALELDRAIKRNSLKANFKSVALGNSWISPLDSVKAWAPLLLNMGIIDYEGNAAIEKSSNKVEEAIRKGSYTLATSLWGQAERVLLSKSENIDFYNILKPIPKYLKEQNMLKSNFENKTEEEYFEVMFNTLVKRNRDLFDNRDDKLEKLMRGPVSKALSVPNHISWGSQSNLVFSALNEDFMKPVINIVEKVLNETNIEVIVYSGQLDLICATLGTVNWIEKMKWPSKSKYINEQRKGYAVNGIIEGFTKKAGNFSMYWINRAGHMAPEDNPISMSYILKQVTKYG